MNKKLTNLLNKRIIFNICGWNITHVLAHYFIYIICDTKNKLKKIIKYDILWFLLEYAFYIFICKDKEIVEPNTVYINVYKPRLDDFFFNFLGIYFYIKIHNKKILK